MPPSESRRLTPEEVAAMWEAGKIQPWHVGNDLPAPRGERHTPRLRDDRTPMDTTTRRRKPRRIEE